MSIKQISSNSFVVYLWSCFVTQILPLRQQVWRYLIQYSSNSAYNPNFKYQFHSLILLCLQNAESAPSLRVLASTLCMFQSSTSPSMYLHTPYFYEIISKTLSLINLLPKYPPNSDAIIDTGTTIGTISGINR
jgi:hypothetical protein